jgi:hypothetical protein
MSKVLGREALECPAAGLHIGLRRSGIGRRFAAHGERGVVVRVAA